MKQTNQFLSGLVVLFILTAPVSDAFARALFTYPLEGQTPAAALADRAVADSTKAIEIKPKVAGYYVTRATAYTLKRDREHAIADYRKALAVDPSKEFVKEVLERWGVKP